jgi:drug/metabolite transporter (DMT)-like permease
MEIESSKEQNTKWSIIKSFQNLSSAQRLGILSVLGAVILWSSSYIVTKIGVGDIPPLTFAAIRFIIATILMGTVAGIKRQKERVSPKDLLRLALGGLLGITAYFSLQNLGVQKTTASDATLLVASFPIITLMGELFFRKTKINLKQIGGIIIAIFGISLIMNISTIHNASERLIGDLLLLATGVAWALYNFATQILVKKYSTITIIFWQTLFGMIALLPLALTETAKWRSINTNGLLGALYLGLFCSVGAFLLYAYGLKSLQPGLAVVLLNLVPVFGLFFAALFLHENIGIVQILGGSIVIAGVILCVSSAPKQPE